MLWCKWQPSTAPPCFRLSDCGRLITITAERYDTPTAHRPDTSSAQWKNTPTAHWNDSLSAQCKDLPMDLYYLDCQLHHRCLPFVKLLCFFYNFYCFVFFQTGYFVFGHIPKQSTRTCQPAKGTSFRQHHVNVSCEYMVTVHTNNSINWRLNWCICHEHAHFAYLLTIKKSNEFKVPFQ